MVEAATGGQYMLSRTSTTEHHLMKRGLETSWIVLYQQNSNIAEDVGSSHTSLFASLQVRRQVELFFFISSSNSSFVSCHLNSIIYRNKTGGADPCPWLLRSPETETFNLLDVEEKWDVWVGDIVKVEVTTVCNECNDNYDCNLNGVCNKSSKECECNDEDGVQYLGEPFVPMVFFYNVLWKCYKLSFPFPCPSPKACIVR